MENIYNWKFRLFFGSPLKSFRIAVLFSRTQQELFSVDAYVIHIPGTAARPLP